MIVIVTPIVPGEGMAGLRHVHLDATAIVQGTGASIDVQTEKHGTYSYDPARQHIEVVRG